MLKRDLTELNKLEEYLKAHKIPYERRDEETELPFGLDRHQIGVPVLPPSENCKWDAICHYGSYGVEHGLLEIAGSLVDEEKDGDSVCGWLTAEDVIARIEKE